MPDPLSSKPLADLSDPLATQSSLDSNTNPPRSGDVEADEIDLRLFWLRRKAKANSAGWNATAS